jgi:hypothetical protein
MKKIHYAGLVLIAISLNSCYMLVGSVFRLGFKMGIWSVFILIGLLIWIINKRGNRK